MTGACVLTGTFALALAAGVAPVQAQDAKKEAPKWETSAAAGATISGGNSKGYQATLGINSQRKWSKDEVLLGSQAGYGESTKVDRLPSNNAPDNDNHEDVTTKSDAYAKAFGQWNHLLTDRWFAGVRLDALHDAVAEVNYRFTLSPLAGYYFIKNETTSLAVEFGPSLVHERVAGTEDTYAGIRLAERFQHKFATGARVWQSTEIIPQIDEFKNFIATSEIGVEAPVSKQMGIQLKLQHVYDSDPALAGEIPTGDPREGKYYKLKNDTKLIGSLTYKF